MNLHPLLVHFPVAMLFAYAVIKLAPLRRWVPMFAWRDVERVLLAIGVVGAFLAFLTGDAAAAIARPAPALLDAHSTFATISIWIFCALLLGEIAAFLRERDFVWTRKSGIARVLHFLDRVLCNPAFSGLLACAGLIAISTTGMLGGVIAYGSGADPLAPFLLRLLGIKL